MSITEPLRLSSPRSIEPSWVERFCHWVPVVGWVVGNELEKRRIFPELESLSQQLITRSTQGVGTITWGEPHAQIATFIAHAVKDSFGWPNDYFIADDPFDLMFLGDEGVGIEVFNAVEDYLSVPRGTISNEQIKGCFRMTFGQVVDFLVKLYDEKAFEGE